jgi:methylenetetrahydrofolate dehydrogenase (NADP+)/methenyltetrahydrofolate cyclohydrolase
VSQATIIDGTSVSAELRGVITGRIAAMKARGEPVPGLAVVLVGDDPASRTYVKSKNKRAAEMGMASFEHVLPADTPQAKLLTLIERLNLDSRVHGILVQLPLPRHIDPLKIIESIHPAKDVDGLHPFNAGRLATGGPSLVPCTPLGCLLLLKRQPGGLSGKRAVVLGRSNLVGKPMAQLLIRESATVTVAHSRTVDLPSVCREADVLVAAVGKPELVRGDWIKPGAVVIDVGINRVDGRLIGDVAYAEAAAVAGAITPVPGGVGPMTIAMLMRNTLEACCRQNDLPFEELV